MATSPSLEQALLQRLRSSDPTLGFLIVAPSLQHCQRDSSSLDELIEFKLPELISWFLVSNITRASFASSLASRGIVGPCLCETWPVAGFFEALAINSALTTLAIRRCHLKEEHARQFGRTLAFNSTLQTLVLQWLNKPELWVPSLAEGLAGGCALTSLSIDNSKIGDAGITIGEALASNSTLTFLSMCGSEIGDAVAAKIGEGLAANSSLTSLILRRNHIEDVGGEKIGEALAVNSTLTELNLSINYLGEIAGAKIGEALATNSSLRILFLSFNWIQGIAGVKFGEALSVNYALTCLDLSRNKIGDDGGVKIGEALIVNHTLTQLELFGNEIKDIGIDKICEGLAANPYLTKLSLTLYGSGLPDILIERNQNNLRLRNESLFELLFPYVFNDDSAESDE